MPPWLLSRSPGVFVCASAIVLNPSTAAVAVATMLPCLIIVLFLRVVILLASVLRSTLPRVHGSRFISAVWAPGPIPLQVSAGTLAASK